MLVKNISSDTLGFAGRTFGPYAVILVDDEVGAHMVQSHPSKFQMVPVVGGGSDNRAMDTRQPVHRHYYRQGNNRCSCGRKGPGK